MSEVVIITGGSRGIGAATARLMGSKGWSVVVNHRNSQAAALEVVADVERLGGRAWAVQGDVGTEADVLHLFSETERVFGMPTGLVNNAGIVGPRKRRIEDMDVAIMTEVMRVNVIGALLCAREAAKRMSTRHGGAGGVIVNVSSVGALTGSPFTFMDYAASKGAMDTFNQGMATELAAYGVRVNGVRPGLIDTDIHASAGMEDRVSKVAAQMPVGRAGSALEVAEVIAFLLSPASSYVTGSMINVSGGVR
ncbi:MAG: SDR family oxidoreductase [Betaproteobacteria bacterium]|nr:SDR family oxidoreductase [Betaproteobacteria bacterium]NBY06301.1 SDR family oxidoreductase [Betaproteobacteria bacterium]